MTWVGVLSDSRDCSCMSLQVTEVCILALKLSQGCRLSTLSRDPAQVQSRKLQSSQQHLLSPWKTHTDALVPSFTMTMEPAACQPCPMPALQFRSPVEKAQVYHKSLIDLIGP